MILYFTDDAFLPRDVARIASRCKNTSSSLQKTYSEDQQTLPLVQLISISNYLFFRLKPPPGKNMAGSV